ncbi:MAG: 2-amino-4-hydroxy-6-hydroxymethyldihydropteridine diphosphokinase [Thiohalomonadales bacterium]
MSIAYLGLGSNLNGPVSQIKAAIQSLGLLPDCIVRQVSSLYTSPPMGPVIQADYINAVVALQTRFDPVQLLDNLQAIERQQGRIRGVRWGPRTLDIDILLYEQLRIDSERLKIPHPGLCERNFVLYPLHEIAPDVHIPGKGSIDEYLHCRAMEPLREFSTEP